MDVEAPAAQSIIQRKLLIPPLPERWAERPRLEKRLADLMTTKRAVLVTAAAGSGKTTAVAGAAQNIKPPVAWLTVDRPDVAPGRLVTYLEAAVARVRPEAAGVATGAVAAGIPHAEAAGLLAEAMGPDPVVLVLDELERLGSEPTAWSVIESLLRYLPLGACLVMVSRRDVPTGLCALPVPPAIAVVADEDVAFTTEEAELALSRLGTEVADVGAAVASTAGWVTGVLFEAWRSEEPLTGQGGETDPLFEYMASQLLGELDDDARDFLVSTALLDAVTAPRAEALGLAGAGETLGALRSAHLPVTWEEEGRVMRAHSFFREYLLTRLERQGDEPLRELRLAYARLLAAEGHHEDAVEVFLRAGAPEEALAPAEQAIVGVVERLDVDIAERWIAALGVRGDGSRQAAWLTTAELMLAIAGDQVARGVEMADRLAAAGEREAVAASSDRAALLMCWCYIHHGRWEDIESLLELATPGSGPDTMRYAMSALTDRPGKNRPGAPGRGGGPLDAMLCMADYVRGRLTAFGDEPSSSWIDAMERPWRVAALRARGRTKEAVEAYDRSRHGRFATATMVMLSGPEVLMDAGRWEEAEALVEEARALAAERGSVPFLGMARVFEAKLALRHRGDAAAALEALERPEARRAREIFRFIGELGETWGGLALLLEGRDAEAQARLRAAVQSMVAAGRVLELPSAAVFLSEAEWRAGEHEAADRAAETALEAARSQGSNHLLLQALSFFPAVVSRRVDTEAGAESPWHELGRALVAQGVAVSASVQRPVTLHEFGRREIFVEGEEVKPKIAKSYELLAYVLAETDGECDRDQLLEVLFDGQRDDSKRAYLRQAIRWLRESLPEEAFSGEGQTVRVGGALAVSSESVELESRLAEAARLQGAERLSATLEALSVFDQGPYLPGTRARWADEREQRLTDLVTEARYQAAVLAFGEDRLDEARALIEAVLSHDRFREAAWRLAMRVALALGDADAAKRTFQACGEALAELASEPSSSTRLLLDRALR